MKTRICRVCGGPNVSNSPNVKTCGSCRKAVIENSRNGHVYARTHVHTWPDGKRTIEAGVTCDATNHQSPDQPAGAHSFPQEDQ